MALPSEDCGMMMISHACLVLLVRLSSLYFCPASSTRCRTRGNNANRSCQARSIQHFFSWTGRLRTAPHLSPERTGASSRLSPSPGAVVHLHGTKRNNLHLQIVLACTHVAGIVVRMLLEVWNLGRRSNNAASRLPCHAMLCHVAMLNPLGIRLACNSGLASCPSSEVQLPLPQREQWGQAHRCNLAEIPRVSACRGSSESSGVHDCTICTEIMEADAW